MRGDGGGALSLRWTSVSIRRLDLASEEAIVQAGPHEPSGSAGQTMRFEATVHPGEKGPPLERVADLDLDRVPDPQGGVRVVVTAEDAAQLVARGYEVLLVRALPVQPLDPALVVDDESTRAWLEEQTRGIERQQGS
jgi:hypothetical protein